MITKQTNTHKTQKEKKKTKKAPLQIQKLSG